MWELIERYDWVQQLDVVLTFAVITGQTEAKVVRAYGGDPTERRNATMAEAEDAALDDPGWFYFQVFSHENAVVALENNGWSGTVPEIARRASAGGRFLSVHWNVNGMFRITEAIEGAVTAFFEPTLGSEAVAPDDVIPAWVAGAGFTSEHLRATCLAVVEQKTGVAFDRAWCETELPTYRIPDPDDLLANVQETRIS